MAMEEEYSIDPSLLLQAATEFAYSPVALSDDSAKEFLNRFPLPALINTLQTKADHPGLEDALVNSLDRIFRTKHGASLIPHFMPFVVVGLGADSQKVRCLACKVVSCLMENTDETIATNLIIHYGVYPPLLDCLVHGEEQVATAAMDAIKNLAGSPKGMGVVFPLDGSEETHLGNLIGKCSSLGRVRILALIVKLFSISSSVASLIYNSKLLTLLEVEVNDANDTLVTLSVLELLYELSEVPHSVEFLSKTTLLQLLSSIISNESAESILRSRAMMITGRLLSKENAFVFIDESSCRVVVAAIDKSFDFQSQEADECEYALEALGQIGLTNTGAALLLASSPPAARHITDAAFVCQHHNKKLAALHALGNICGETRYEDSILLNNAAEESLQRLIYEAATRTSKLTPSGLLLSILQHDSEIRLAGYRLITGLVARSWCLMEILSREEIIDVVTGTLTETNKIGMEARHKCCEAIYKAFSSSNRPLGYPGVAESAAKLQEAIRRGPFPGRRNKEAQPVVMTAERF